jgi:hypothetical protein
LMSRSFFKAWLQRFEIGSFAKQLLHLLVIFNILKPQNCGLLQQIGTNP